MELSGVNLLRSLREARWRVAANTYGNNHATLIGLLVDWWISLAPERHRAMEGGPSYGYFKKGVGGGMCDAIFCENLDAIGVLEVEGTRRGHTIEKIGGFFDSRLADLKALKFAVAVFYPVSPTGRGRERTMPPPQDAAAVAMITEVSGEYPGRPIVVIALGKAYERQVEGIRNRNDYYKSTLISVEGLVYEGGKEVARSTLWRRRP